MEKYGLRWGGHFSDEPDPMHFEFMGTPADADRITASLEEDDMTGEQARQLEAIFKGLTVQGTHNPEETVDLMFNRIKNIEAAINVPGTTSAEQAFNLLFERVRNIEDMVKDLKRP